VQRPRPAGLADSAQPPCLQGLVVYHWSVALGLEKDVAPLSTGYENVLVHFDAQFAALKYGSVKGFAAPGANKWLQFFLGGQLAWLAEVPTGR
jgi:hypothetical protein